MIKFALYVLMIVSTPAAAEVVDASSNGFETRHTVDMPLSSAAAYKTFLDLGAWWDPAHTYSGDARNLTLQAVPGGCFCERNPTAGGGVEHMRVVYVEPGKRIVLTGSLGPLLYEATTGVMDVQVKPSGSGSQLTVNYRVAGFAKGGADKLAPVVDTVLGTQMTRLRAYAASRPKS